MAIRGNRSAFRQNIVLDSRRVPVDGEGKVSRPDFEHYQRSIEDWSRNVARQVEGRNIVKRRSQPANSSAFSSTDFVDDMAVLNVPVTAGLGYGVHVEADATWGGTPAGARWTANMYAGGTRFGRVADLDGDVIPYINGWTWYFAEHNAKLDFELQLEEISGTGTLTLLAADNIPRAITIVGFGIAPIEF